MADVIEGVDCDEKPLVVSISIYKPENYLFAVHNMFDIDYDNFNILELLYVNEDFSICTKIIAPLDQTVYSKIENLSEEFALLRENTDKVSQVLIESFSFESAFKSALYDDSMKKNTLSEQDVQLQLMSMPTYGVYSNENKTVRLNDFDDYTDYDKYLSAYETTYKNNVHTFTASGATNKASDDPIVNIISKNLFKYRGIYSYIGKEYGFYIKTVQNYDNDNISDFIVFDIETVLPYLGRNNDEESPSVTIRPVFSGEVKYYDSLGGIVVYSNFDDPNLALANIQVAGSINNLYEKNIGDSGYNAYEDYGYSFNSFYVEAVGTGLGRDKKKVDLQWLKTAFGAAKLLNSAYPGVGTAVSVVGKSLTSALEFSLNQYYESTRNKFDSMDKIGENTYKTSKITLGNGNTRSIIDRYGNLIKGFETELLNSNKARETDSPLLYKTSEHYYKLEYSFCQSDSSINWDSIVAMSISLDIYTDTTRKILGIFKGGELTKQDSVIGGRVDYYNERPSSSNGGSINESTFYHAEFTKDPDGEGKHTMWSYIPAEGSYKDFYFTPNRTFTYVIETINRSANADLYLKIYDSNDNLLASNDDGGTKDKYSSIARNSKITITLTGGSTYKIRTLCYGYRAGYFEFIVRKDATLLESASNNLRANPTTITNDTIWYTFVPVRTGFYSLYTVGTSDTYLTLYDSVYNKYAFNDDGGTNRNSIIDMYLIAGQTYYLKVNCFAMGSGTFDVYANLQRIVRLHEKTGNAYYKYIVNEGEANFFRYTAKLTKNIKIYTYSSTSDPYIELYDENMNLITYNDDGGEGREALLTYSFQANKIYYIKVRNYSSTAVGSGDVIFAYV